MSESLKAQGILVYNKPVTYIFVQADDPDGACEAAIMKMRGNILREKSNRGTRDIAKELHETVRVVKIRTIRYA